MQNQNFTSDKSSDTHTQNNFTFIFHDKLIKYWIPVQANAAVHYYTGLPVQQCVSYPSWRVCYVSHFTCGKKQGGLDLETLLDPSWIVAGTHNTHAHTHTHGYTVTTATGSHGRGHIATTCWERENCMKEKQVSFIHRICAVAELFMTTIIMLLWCKQFLVCGSVFWNFIPFVLMAWEESIYHNHIIGNSNMFRPMSLQLWSNFRLLTVYNLWIHWSAIQMEKGKLISDLSVS